MANSLLRLLPGIVLLMVVAAAGRGAGPFAQSSGQGELMLACQAALWKKTFDEATAAGLNPPATPVTFEARKAAITRRNGKLTAVGTEDYRPAVDIPAFPVRYECVVDLASGKVESITYTAVGANGALSTKAPTTIVRETQVVRACRAKMWEKVAGTAIDRGVPAGNADVELDAEGALLAPKGTTIDVSGQGRIRLSQDYEWQPVAFTCRYDAKKKEATRASYTLDRTSVARSPAAALSPDKARALDACHSAVEEEVERDAIRRGYRRLWRIRIELKPGASFNAVGQDLEVKGRGEYKLDDRHSQPTPLTFTCRYDPRAAAVRSAAFEAGQASWTPSGEVATAKTATLICESTRAVQQVCSAPIKGNVRIIRQRSSTPCEAYKNWIWSLSGITVWGGCRAEFEYETR